MKILRADDHRRMPWKNGNGVTTEIAVHPPSADLAHFGWRVSMASVAEDGPFSVFPGIDRTLSILEGAGMELAVEGQGRMLMTLETPPYGFAADAATTARLVSGPIADLNVMTRRGLFTHGVERIGLFGELPLVSGPGVTLIMARGPMRFLASSVEEALVAHDCVLFSGAATACRLHADAPAVFFRIDIAAIAEPFVAEDWDPAGL